VSIRKLVFSGGLVASLSACQLPNETPANAPPTKVVLAPSEPAPLPPEETPPAEATAPARPAEAKPAEPGITSTGAPARGKLPKAVIDEKLKSVGPAVQACYERALTRKPDLHGAVDIDFVVAPDGKVAHADASDTADALNDAPTVDCILNAVRKLEFPAPSGGRVFINYPLRLEPPKASAP